MVPAGYVKYKVKPADTLSSIAAQFGTTWEAIYEDIENVDFRHSRPDPNLIVAGDTLYIRRQKLIAEHAALEAKAVEAWGRALIVETWRAATGAEPDGHRIRTLGYAAGPPPAVVDRGLLRRVARRAAGQAAMLPAEHTEGWCDAIIDAALAETRVR